MCMAYSVRSRKPSPQWPHSANSLGEDDEVSVESCCIMCCCRATMTALSDDVGDGEVFEGDVEDDGLMSSAGTQSKEEAKTDLRAGFFFGGFMAERGWWSPVDGDEHGGTTIFGSISARKSDQKNHDQKTEGNKNETNTVPRVDSSLPCPMLPQMLI